MIPEPAVKTPATSLAVVIVTFNRSKDLQQLLEKLTDMSSDFTHLVVVDNASTDDTGEIIARFQPELGEKLIARTMPENTGGAGGFHEGIRVARELPVDWIWLSDDDAIPHSDCFLNILAAATSPEAVYGSVALVNNSDGHELCWPSRRVTGNDPESPVIARYRSELEELREVNMLPFLGFMVSRMKVLEIGLPNERYFISGDDMQYSIRLRKSGARLFLVKGSVVVHPQIPRYSVSILGRRIDCLRMPPWRRKLDIRNRVWNARLENGIAGALFTTLVLLPRVLFTLIHERPAGGQISAYLAGFRDGLFKYGRSGNKNTRTVSG